MNSRWLSQLGAKDKWLFLTWPLHGSLPHPSLPPNNQPSAGQTFGWIDRRLDTARSGPSFLGEEPVASIVAESLYRGMEIGHYRLGPFVIMANHVHVLLLPLVSPSRFLKSLKSVTARNANRVLGRTGEAFWQRESYDHWVRDEQEWTRVATYIENHPVKAGLVFRPENYRWSSAHEMHRQRSLGAHDSMRYIH